MPPVCTLQKQMCNPKMQRCQTKLQNTFSDPELSVMNMLLAVVIECDKFFSVHALKSYKMDYDASYSCKLALHMDPSKFYPSKMAEDTMIVCFKQCDCRLPGMLFNEFVVMFLMHFTPRTKSIGLEEIS